MSEEQHIEDLIMLAKLKDQQRKRPPTKKPQDGEVVLVQDVWNDLVLAIFSGENFEDKHSTVIADHSIRHWWPIKHLLESDK